MRAGHRAEHEFFPVYIERRIHGVAVMRIVAALLIKLQPRYVWRLDVQITSLGLFFYYKFLYFALDHGPCGQKHREPFADLLVDIKKFQFRPEFFMIALFHDFYILLQLFVCAKAKRRLLGRRQRERVFQRFARSPRVLAQRSSNSFLIFSSSSFWLSSTSNSPEAKPRGSRSDFDLFFMVGPP